MSPQNIDELLLKAQAAHQSKNTLLAKKLYLKVLKKNPRTSTAHNNLAAIFLAEKKLDKATYHFNQACLTDPNNSNYYINLAKTLEIKSDWKNAALAWKSVYKKEPDNKTAFVRFLTTALKSDTYESSSINVLPDDSVPISKILFASIFIRYAQQSSHNAESTNTCLTYILNYYSQTTLSPKEQIAELRINQDEDCHLIAFLEKLLDIGFYNHIIDHLFFLILNSSCKRRSSRLIGLQGIGLQRIGQNETALRLLHNSYQTDSSDVFIHEYYSLALALTGHLSEAFKISVKHDLLNVVSGVLAFQSCDFYKAWKIYNSSCTHALRDPNLPTIDSLSLIKDKKILIYRDQGLGDEIMFLSCLEDVLLLSPKQIIYECDPRLKHLIQRSFPSIITVDSVDDSFSYLNSMGPVDYAVRLSFLPSLFRLSLEDFSKQKHPYLSADPGTANFWKSRLDQLPKQLNVGFAWKGGINFKRGFKLDQLPLLKPLFKIPNINWINLQYGDTQEETSFISSNFSATLHHWDDLDYTNDIVNLTGLISQLDLVIQVNNTSFHLAGALGKTAWAILPFHSFDMRWYVDSESNQFPWYPNARLFRQTEGQTLEQLISDVSLSLLNFGKKND